MEVELGTLEDHLLHNVSADSMPMNFTEIEEEKIRRFVLLFCRPYKVALLNFRNFKIMIFFCFNPLKAISFINVSFKCNISPTN